MQRTMVLNCRFSTARLLRFKKLATCCNAGAYGRNGLPHARKSACASSINSGENFGLAPPRRRCDFAFCQVASNLRSNSARMDRAKTSKEESPGKEGNRSAKGARPARSCESFAHSARRSGEGPESPFVSSRHRSDCFASSRHSSEKLGCG